MNTTSVAAKMTYVTALTAAVNCEALSKEVREKLEALRIQQEKRNTAEKKPTKVQQENQQVKAAITAELALHPKAVTVSELQAGNAELKALSNQKVSALVRQLVEEGAVEKVVEGRKSLFRLAPAGDVGEGE